MPDISEIIPNVSVVQKDRLQQFAEIVGDWNQRINLISRRDVQHLWENHILPSLFASVLIDIPQNSWVLDMGSGGGFPAIPLNILRPDLQLLMVESIRKKARFLAHAIAELRLGNAIVVNERLEILGKRGEFRGKFHVITARAVAAIPRLIKWGRPFLREGGFFLLWKGSSDIPEVEKHADSLGYAYEIHRVPEKYHAHSPKFPALCFFVLKMKPLRKESFGADFYG